MRSLYLAILITIFCSSFTSCRKGEEINRYELSQEELDFVPYTESTTVPFKHSRGFEFSFVVKERHSFWDRTRIVHAGDDYTSFQVDKTRLISIEPELEIIITLYPEEISNPMDLSINRHEFKLYTKEKVSFDSLEINGKVYREIFVLRYEQMVGPTAIVPDSILYTRKEGIINIKMTNDEEYILNL